MPPRFKKVSNHELFTGIDGPRVIYWFRTDLRLHDSPALTAALELNPSAFFPIWTWDPHYVYQARVGPNRWQFLTDCQRDVSESISKLNHKQKLWLIREAPQTVFPKLFKLWRITHLVFEKDTDAYARDRDAKVMEMAREAGVEVIVKMGRTLFDPDELVKHNGGKPTMSMAQVQKASAKIKNSDGVAGEPDKPLAPPKSLPDPGDMDLSSIDHEVPVSDPDFNSTHRQSVSSETQYKSIMGPSKSFSIPTLSEMGISSSDATTPHRGGETFALRNLALYCANSDYVGTFEKPKSAPTDFSPQSTTLLSPHLHFGSLSVRQYWHDVQAVIDQRKRDKRPVSIIPVNLPGQLLFRDMYFGAQAALGYAFAQTQGNPIARFIPWDLQSNYSATPVGEHLLDGSYTVNKPIAEVYFRRWKSGTTGFPFIDALMRQLKQEGWIHHLGRHMVACFLTRGGCYVSWERGAEVFEEWLIDHETACNVGNWMWLSCTAFFSQFYRVYSPVAFGKKWDPEGTFVRRFVPELKLYDKKYIYEPWKAPIADQKAWGCVVKGNGTDRESDAVGGMKVYPKPMLDFDEKREFCIQEIKTAYRVGLRGDDPKVLDGSWKKVFDYDDENADIKDETKGLVERSKKRSLENDDTEMNGNGDDKHDDGEVEKLKEKKQRTIGVQKSDAKAQRKGKGKQQTTLDLNAGIKTGR